MILCSIFVKETEQPRHYTSGKASTVSMNSGRIAPERARRRPGAQLKNSFAVLDSAVPVMYNILAPQGAG